MDKLKIDENLCGEHVAGSPYVGLSVTLAYTRERERERARRGGGGREGVGKRKEKEFASKGYACGKSDGEKHSRGRNIWQRSYLHFHGLSRLQGLAF